MKLSVTAETPLKMRRAFALPAIGALFLAAAWSLPERAYGQLIDELEYNTNNIGQYDPTTGATIHTVLITPPTSGEYDNIGISGNILYVGNDATTGGTPSITTYNATTGASISSSFITATSAGVPAGYSFYPEATTVVGATLYVAEGDGFIGTYNAATGAKINPALTGTANTGGISDVQGLAVSGSDLFVMNTGTNQVLEYTTSGTLLNKDFLNLSSFGQTSFFPGGFAISGGTMYVSYENSNASGSKGYVAEFDATSGALINATFVSVGASYFIGAVAVTGNDLYVGYTNANGSAGAIGEYDATAGTAINASLVSGSADPGLDGIVFTVPEPSSAAGILLGGAALLGVRRRGTPRPGASIAIDS